MRIYGNLFHINELNYTKDHILFLSNIELSLGLEIGLFKIGSLENFFIKEFGKRQSIDRIFLFDFSESIKIGDTIKNQKQDYKAAIILHWRESRGLIKKIKKSCFHFSNILENGATVKHICIKFDKLFPKNFWLKSARNKFMLAFSIFRDLWFRGFIISAGIKYGSLFIVYSGPLSLVHSCMCIRVIEKHSLFSASTLVSHGRLGTIIKKSIAFAFVDCKLFIRYISLKWKVDLP